MLGLDALELDGDFFAGDDVGACRRSVDIWYEGDQICLTEVNVTKATAANFAADTVFVSHTKIL